MIKHLIRIPAIVIMAISWYLSEQSVIPMMPTFYSADKVVHLFCFAGLAFAWTLWFSTDNWRKHSLRNLIVCILIVSVYGVVDEFHQSFVPSREASAADWCADTLAVIGSVCGSYAMRKITLLSKIL